LFSLARDVLGVCLWTNAKAMNPFCKRNGIIRASQDGIINRELLLPLKV